MQYVPTISFPNMMAEVIEHEFQAKVNIGCVDQSEPVWDGM